jgi:hypothetical protein
MEEIKPSIKHTLIFWWACTWRTVVIVLPISLVLGFFVGVAAALLGGDVSHLETPLAAIGYLLGLGVYIYILNKMLGHNFGDFRVALIRSTAADSDSTDGSNSKADSDSDSDQTETEV